MLTQEIADNVEKLTPLLKQFSRSEYGIALGGAHAKGIADSESDLDLYVFATDVRTNEERAGLAGKFPAVIRDITSWGTTDPFDQAGTDFYLGGLKVECWLRNSVAIARAIGECADGIVKRDFVTWTTTGFYTHCVLSDLKHMIPVDDPSGLLAGWKEAIRTYPPKLRKTIITRHLNAARFWPENFHYHSAIERQDVIYCTGIVQQVIHNLIQVLFAANEIYFPGDKKLAEVMAHFHRLPNAFTDRVNRLLFPATPPSLNTLRQIQKELQSLVKETSTIAEQP
jgi:hypothetical protein